jgi:hypothetical protein
MTGTRLLLIYGAWIVLCALVLFFGALLYDRNPLSHVIVGGVLGFITGPLLYSYFHKRLRSHQ